MNDSPFPPLTPEQEAQGYVQITWQLIAVVGWIIALMMLVGILGHERRLLAHALAVEKIPVCVNRPFPYDPQDHMRSE